MWRLVPALTDVPWHPPCDEGLASMLDHHLWPRSPSDTSPPPRCGLRVRGARATPFRGWHYEAVCRCVGRSGADGRAGEAEAVAETVSPTGPAQDGGPFVMRLFDVERASTFSLSQLTTHSKPTGASK